MTYFGVFARSDFQLAPSLSAQSQQMRHSRNVRPEKGRSTEEIFWNFSDLESGEDVMPELFISF